MFVVGKVLVCVEFSSFDSYSLLSIPCTKEFNGAFHVLPMSNNNGEYTTYIVLHQLRYLCVMVHIGIKQDLVSG